MSIGIGKGISIGGLGGAAPYENLISFSQAFDNAAWAKTNGTITADAAVAPDGSTTADRLNWAVSTNPQAQRTDSAIAAGSALNMSAHGKAGTRSSLTLISFTDGSNFAQCAFDLIAGTAAAPTSAGTRYTDIVASIQDVGSGWYRCSLALSTNTLTAANLWVRGGTLVGSGDNILIWGAQQTIGRELRPYKLRLA